MIDLTEKTLAADRKYTWKVISVYLLDSKTLSAWLCWKLKGNVE